MITPCVGQLSSARACCQCSSVVLGERVLSVLVSCPRRERAVKVGQLSSARACCQWPLVLVSCPRRERAVSGL
ncbi:hypothetical protein DPMN_083113 [Dreissena polymorpha]|uniref:Uncharacterized protein n=1 Tax=Dreissena polymorpha TaxID=45954 RepID=A0A9D3YC15_DREPO|nr:hypothetical protein DPMN_083113 [Dreissena polymorpha]